MSAPEDRQNAASTQLLRIVLYPPFSGNIGQTVVQVPFEPGLTAARALQLIGSVVPSLAGRFSVEGFDHTHLALSGGRLLKPESELNARDEVLLLPVMAGG